MANLDQIADYLCPVSVPVTLTAATGVVNSVSAYKFGVFTIVIYSVRNTAATNAGSNIFSGTLSINPAFRTATVQYNGSVCSVTQVLTDGVLNCRALIGSWAANAAVEGTIILYTG